MSHKCPHCQQLADLQRQIARDKDMKHMLREEIYRLQAELDAQRGPAQPHLRLVKGGAQ